VQPQVISSQFVSASDEPVGSLMVWTDVESDATHMAHGWGEQHMRKPFVRMVIHHSTCEVPDDEAETCEGVRVWELLCWRTRHGCLQHGTQETSRCTSTPSARWGDACSTRCGYEERP
jgi:hypothetical protein